MHAELMRQVAMSRLADLHRNALRRGRSRSTSGRPLRTIGPVKTAIQLRVSACREELERLAALSERQLHGGDWLVAEVDGVPVAAVAVDDGTTVYDPFRPTSQAVSLLRLRRKQVLAAA